jgi:undecaprenyl diphosphate synthase
LPGIAHGPEGAAAAHRLHSGWKLQTERFRDACVAFALEIAKRGAALLVLGDETSAQFPPELKAFRQRSGTGTKVNSLVNYGWEWDLDGLHQKGKLRSAEVSRLDLVVRWVAAAG